MVTRSASAGSLALPRPPGKIEMDWRDQANCPSPTPNLLRNQERSKVLLAPIADLAQSRYEKGLLQEIGKLQAALVEERDLLAAHTRTVEAHTTAEKERRVSGNEKASRLYEMELAIERAQNSERRAFVMRRAEDDSRQKGTDEETKKRRAAELRKIQQQREAAAEAHRLALEKHANEKAAADKAKRERDAAKEKALRDRLKAEQQASLEREHGSVPLPPLHLLCVSPAGDPRAPHRQGRASRCEDRAGCADP